MSEDQSPLCPYSERKHKDIEHRNLRPALLRGNEDNHLAVIFWHIHILSFQKSNLNSLQVSK